jgi:lysophospholipase L1-like esterase
MRSVLCLLAMLLLPPLSPAATFNPASVVFIGSSSIEYWKTLQQDFKPAITLNLGVGGTTYSFLLDHAAEWAEQYPAHNYVIYSGDNDLEAGLAPEEVTGQFERLAGILHEKIPDVHISLISVKPCPSRVTNLPKVRELNERLKRAADSLAYVTFVDIYPSMLNPDDSPRSELFVGDGLHMNGAGYRIWTEALRVELSDVDYFTP